MARYQIETRQLQCGNWLGSGMENGVVVGSLQGLGFNRKIDAVVECELDSIRLGLMKRVIDTRTGAVVAIFGDEAKFAAAAERMKAALIKTEEVPELTTFEITAAGFDASTDETDDRVFWVKAKTLDDVLRAIGGTGAGACTVVGQTCEAEIDYTLPADVVALRKKLFHFQATRPTLKLKKPDPETQTLKAELTEQMAALQKRNYHRDSGLFVVYEQAATQRLYLQGVMSTSRHDRTPNVLQALVCTENYAKRRAEEIANGHAIPIELAFYEETEALRAHLAELEE